MKVTVKQINSIDEKLIRAGFHFMDIRFEVLDHIVCLLEARDGDFETELDKVFTSERGYLLEQKKSFLFRMAGARINLFRDLLWNPFFIVLWILSFTLYLFLPYPSVKELLNDLDVLPVALPIAAFVLHGWYFFRSKNKVTGTFAALFSVSMLLQVYLLFVLPLVRTMENIGSVAILSLFTAIGLMMYYLFFEYKRKNEAKYRKLLS